MRFPPPALRSPRLDGSMLRHHSRGVGPALGKGCFISARTIILKDVTIGDGTVIAASAIVIQDLPSAPSSNWQSCDIASLEQPLAQT